VTALLATARSWPRSSAQTTRARAAPGDGFKRCCRPTGSYDGVMGDHYIRDRVQERITIWRAESFDDAIRQAEREAHRPLAAR
jgi:hypothetical protein